MGKFQDYLAERATCTNLDPGSEFFAGTVDCTLAVAARHLVQDGMSAKDVAYLYASAAIEVLCREGGLRGDEAPEQVMAWAASFRFNVEEGEA